MATVLLVLVVVLVLAALVFGVMMLLGGDDPGLGAAEPDGRALPLPNDRSLTESDLKTVRFDVALRGYRMAQVDRVLRRTAYDVGYKDEMIAVLEAEVAALRDGRVEDAELLRKAREAAANPTAPSQAGLGLASGAVPSAGERHAAADPTVDGPVAADADGPAETAPAGPAGPAGADSADSADPESGLSGDVSEGDLSAEDAPDSATDGADVATQTEVAEGNVAVDEPDGAAAPVDLPGRGPRNG